MAAYPAPDNEEQTDPAQKKQKPAPARLSEIVEAPTEKLGERVSPTSRQPAAPASRRPPAVANATTKLLGPLPPRPGSAPTSAASSAAIAQPTQVKVVPDRAQNRENGDIPGYEVGAGLSEMAPGNDREFVVPPAPPGTGSARFFWLQGVALRIAERIEGTLQEAPFWHNVQGRTPEKRQAVRVQAQSLLERMPTPKQFQNQDEEEFLLRIVEDEVLGYGPLEPVLVDERVSEIMVVEPSLIYVERAGKIVETAIRFQDEDHLMRVIQAILRPLGRSVNRASPMADGRLPDGSRVHVVVPPAAVKGPTLTIRKFSRKPLLLEDLVGLGTLTAPMAELLRACVLARLNIVVSGGSGSGKTTLLNALSACIPEDERIVTIEDAAELQLQQRHVVSLEATPAELDGSGRVTIRDLVVNALRMRPSRIVIGECRSGEALDMLQAMNTGHDGSLTTAHANNPRDCLVRLETMAMMAGLHLPAQIVRRQIGGALQMIIHQARLRDGSRKVTHITEVQGIDGETIILQDLFRFQEMGTDPATGKVLGTFEPGGFRPKCYPRFEALNIQFPKDFFLPEERRHGLGWEPISNKPGS